MAYPTELNNQYKAEKAAGTTTAKSFPEWNKLRLAALEIQDVVIQEQTLAEAIQIAEQALEVAETATTTAKSKAAICLEIYEAQAAAATPEHPLVRKNLIKAFKEIAYISEKGASTYLQNIKRKKGLIKAQA
jgi:hypothetical protein